MFFPLGHIRILYFTKRYLPDYLSPFSISIKKKYVKTQQYFEYIIKADKRQSLFYNQYNICIYFIFQGYLPTWDITEFLFTHTIKGLKIKNQSSIDDKTVKCVVIFLLQFYV